LLAVRFPHVFEEIGGQSEDWDDTWSSKYNLNLGQRITGVIVEVKTGRLNAKMLETSFAYECLTTALYRLGFWPQGHCYEVANQLASVSTWYDNGFQVAKLLIMAETPPHSATIPPCLQMTLTQVETFIERRMEKYTRRKSADRMFFPDDLSQYFAWKTGVNRGK
jgi:hypothetical protein